MRDGRSPLALSLESLAERLEAVERRLSALEEGRGAPSPAELEPGPAPPPGVIPQPPDPEAASPITAHAAELLRGELMPLVGRTLVVFAGAFLLRAITEAGLLPQIAGTLLGLIYALVWIGFVDRAAARDRRTSATFHGGAAALIAFPLVWEATVKFGFLTSLASAAALVVVTTHGLLVAYRRSLVQLAWLFTVGGTLTAVALAIGTRSVVLFASCLLALGGGSLWLGFLRRWRAMGWTVAIAVDSTLLLATLIVFKTDSERLAGLLRPTSLVWLLLAAIVVYLGSFAARTVARSRSVRIPEIIQGVVVLLIGLVGAIGVTRAAALTPVPVGLVSLLLAATCYPAAFMLTGGGARWRTNLLFYTTVAMTSVLIGVDALLGGNAEGLAFLGAALLAGSLGHLRGRVILSLHGAMYLTAGAFVSGMLGTAIGALTGAAPAGGSWLVPSGPLVLLVAALLAWVPVAVRGHAWGRFAFAPKALILVVLGLGVDAIAVMAGAGAVDTADPGAVAALRTAVLSLTAVALAWVAARPRLVEARVLVYPYLLVTGIKLVLEDVRGGRPATLFVSLAAYGLALILAPRLLRGAPDPDS